VRGDALLTGTRVRRRGRQHARDTRVEDLTSEFHERAVSRVDPPDRNLDGTRDTGNSSSFSLSESDEPSRSIRHDQTVAPFSDQVRGEFDRDVKIDGAVRSKWRHHA